MKVLWLRPGGDWLHVAKYTPLLHPFFIWSASCDKEVTGRSYDSLELCERVPQTEGGGRAKGGSVQNKRGRKCLKFEKDYWNGQHQEKK